MLNNNDLNALGYTISEDPDLPGQFYWRNDRDGSDISYATEAEAIAAAAADAMASYNLHRCDDCGKVHSDETLADIKHYSMRVSPGGVVPSGECPDCGALCYPIEPEAEVDLGEVAEWVGLHYGRNFEKEPEQKQQEWIERYKEAHSIECADEDSDEDSSDCAQTWEGICAQQGWNEESQIIHLLGFIQSRGLMGELDAYACTAAKEENA